MSDSKSAAARLRNRWRYGLLLQEFLDRLQRYTGIIVYPYYISHEINNGSADPDDARFEIRALTHNDVAEMAEIDVRKRPVDWFRARLDEGARALGAFVDSRLAGYTWASFTNVLVPTGSAGLLELEKAEAYLFSIYVSPEFRGQRLGMQMRHAAYRDLAAIGKTDLYSVSLAFNASTRRFKARLGAQEVELRLLLGLKRWVGLDLRLRRKSGWSRTRPVMLIGKRGMRRESDL